MEAIVILLGTMNLILSALIFGAFSNLSNSLEDLTDVMISLYNQSVIKYNKRK